MTIVREKYFPPVMTISQAADYLQISSDTMYAYATKGSIPGFKLGNRWRFRKDEIDRRTREMQEEQGK